MNASPNRTRARLAGARIVVALAAFTLVGCKATYSERIGEFRAAYRDGDFDRAADLVEDLIAEDSELDRTYVATPVALADAPELARDDAWLLGLELAMTALARGDIGGAKALLARGKLELERHAEATAVDWIESAILDDTYAAYRGYDHEIVLVRAMIALCELLERSGDAPAAVAEISAKQAEFLANGFGGAGSYDYRLLYPRVALGAYLEAILHESAGRASDAYRSYRVARDDGADLDSIRAALARTDRGGAPRSATHGVVHVFGLLGSSPTLIESLHPPTEMARGLAGVAIMLVGDAGSPAMQVPIKVPTLYLNDEFVPSLAIEAPGFRAVDSEAILDLNGLFESELDAWMPWILARAMARRSLKAAASAVLERVIRDSVGGDEGDVAGFVAGAVLNLGSTAVEDADTRSWSTLPAQIHVARLVLPAGVHDIAFGSLARAHVRVDPGRDSFVVVIAPDPQMPGAAIVDAQSRIDN